MASAKKGGSCPRDMRYRITKPGRKTRFAKTKKRAKVVRKSLGKGARVSGC